MAARWVALACWVGLAGCLLETDRQCGPNMILTAENVCVCEPDAVLAPDAFGLCEKCGPNQVAQAGVCACVEGYAESSEGVCVLRPAGLGDVCDPAAPACPSANFPFCQPTGASGYCTKAGCAGPADCPSGFTCDGTSAMSVCKRPPTGQGVPCTTADTCAATEATFCAPILNQCLVENCSLTTSTCSPGYLCCDLTQLGAAKNVCLPLEACP